MKELETLREQVALYNRGEVGYLSVVNAARSLVETPHKKFARHLCVPPTTI